MFSDLINKKIDLCSVVLNQCEKIWVFELDDLLPFWEFFSSFLSEEEKEKSNRLRSELRKKLYILQKGITRKVISNVLNTRPERLVILYDDKNKPYILGENINYNISHSSSYFMIGVSESKRVGVDIQKINVMKKELPVSIFSKLELERYNHLDRIAKREFFWKTWVLKEAITKAMGDGMTTNFCDIDTIFSKVIDENTVELQYSDNVYLNAEVLVNIYPEYAYSCVLINETWSI